MIVCLVALTVVFRATDFQEMILGSLRGMQGIFMPSVVLVSLSLFIVMIAESARIPVDNPETHLELTMVHEAMILEQSGKNLAFMEIASGARQILLLGLLINLLLPIGIAQTLGIAAILVGIIAFILKAVVGAVVVGAFESTIAKLRFFRLPSLFAVAFFLAMLTIMLEVIA